MPTLLDLLAAVVFALAALWLVRWAPATTDKPAPFDPRKVAVRRPEPVTVGTAGEAELWPEVVEAVNDALMSL